FIIFFEIFMLWIKQNAINLLDNIPTNLNLLKLIKIWDKYNNKYIDLNTYNLNKDEFLLSICYELQKIKNDIK
ncbi:MAG: hypothetical protein VW265_04615, partial [Hyphomicrobiales bacterium]